MAFPPLLGHSRLRRLVAGKEATQGRLIAVLIIFPIKGGVFYGNFTLQITSRFRELFL
jgi:hypothetical protein